MAIDSFRSTILLSLIISFLAALLVVIRGLNVAVDFMGGMIIQVHYPEAIASKSVLETLAQAGFSGTSVTEITGHNYDFFIGLPPKEDVLPQRLAQQVVAALRAEHRDVDVISVEVIAPQVGRELAMLGSVPLILAFVGTMIHPAVRYGWRFAASVAGTNARNMAIILGIFLGAYAIFQWEFSLRALMAMDCLAILISGFGAVRALRAARANEVIE